VLLMPSTLESYDSGQRDYPNGAAGQPSAPAAGWTNIGVEEEGLPAVGERVLQLDGVLVVLCDEGRQRSCPEARRLRTCEVT
jgi:hypothetical protein